MGTDTGDNLLDPGDTPHENLQFLFFCTAVIEAVNRHQGLLRASIAAAPQDHRLGANEAPPAIISIFLGDQLMQVFESIERGESGAGVAEGVMKLGHPSLPELEKHPGDRNRTSPFAFTGNKFEFRALGSSQSPSMPNTVLNVIVAEAVDRLASELESAIAGGKSLEDALPDVLRDSWNNSKQVVFNGDNYAEEWHNEAEQRGLLNLRTTPDALPQYLEPSSIEVFGKFNVLSEREIEARYEVFTEQYATLVNIEAETAATMARTQLLPAAIRHLAMLRAAGDGVTTVESLSGEVGEMIEEFTFAIRKLEEVNDHPDDLEGLALAKYIRDSVIPAMDGVREVADRLERVVADDLWPLPRYAEILFIK
jgi:glutamine synthetase